MFKKKQKKKKKRQSVALDHGVQRSAGNDPRHFPTPCLPVTTSGLCGYNILPAHTISLQGHQAVAPRKFPMSHDHPSEVPSSRSTWEGTINPQLQIESSGFGFRCSKAFHLKLNIHLERIAPNHGVRKSTGNAAKKHNVGHLLYLSPSVIYISVIY